MKPQGHVPETASPADHEAADLNPGLILRVAVILIATLLVLVIGGLLLFREFEKEYPARSSEAAPVVSSKELPPEPRLQANPLVDLQTVRAKEDLHLNRYAWVDRAHGIAQIPIDRAMVLWVENDQFSPAPPAATNSPPATGVTELQMRQQKALEAGHAP